MRDVLFMGDILASVTHEMQNVMAIIKESGALADDILNLNGPPRMRYGDKLEESLQHIREQVGRGRDLMLMLNGFAHAASDYSQSCDVVQFARQISILAERMVRMGECRLLVNLDGEPLPVFGNALMIMQSMYLGLSAILDGCASGDTISLLLLRENLDSGDPKTEKPVGSGVSVAAGRWAAAIRIKAENSSSVPEVTRLLPVMGELAGDCRAGAGVLDLLYVHPCGKWGDSL